MSFKQIEPGQRIFFGPKGQVDIADIARPLLPPASTLSRRGYPFTTVDLTPEQHGIPGMPVISVRFQLVWDEKENLQKGFEFSSVKLRLDSKGNSVAARTKTPAVVAPTKRAPVRRGTKTVLPAAVAASKKRATTKRAVAPEVDPLSDD